MQWEEVSCVQSGARWLHSADLLLPWKVKIMGLCSAGPATVTVKEDRTAILLLFKWMTVINVISFVALSHVGPLLHSEPCFSEYQAQSASKCDHKTGGDALKGTAMHTHLLITSCMWIKLLTYWNFYLSIQHSSFSRLRPPPWSIPPAVISKLSDE